MDYTLLTAAHLRENTPPRLDAKREQAYYEAAVSSSMKFESLLETAVFPIFLARKGLTLAGLIPAHIGAVALHFSFGWKARKSMP